MGKGERIKKGGAGRKDERGSSENEGVWEGRREEGREYWREGKREGGSKGVETDERKEGNLE